MAEIRRKTAMNRRKWDPKTKAIIIMEGLRGKPVVQICGEHQISQAQYYQWRDQFLANMPQLFIEENRREKALTKENARLKKIIGDLTIELKKTEEWLR
jgi:transposase-like protein